MRRALLGALAVAIAGAGACTPPAKEERRQAAGGGPISGPAAKGVPPEGAQPSPASDERPELMALEGRWKIVRSSGEDGGGFAFHPRVGDHVVIEHGVLVFATGKELERGSQLRKTLIPLGAASAGPLPPGAIPLEIEHRGTFKPGDAVDADPHEVGAGSKGWSRRALARVEGTHMTLAAAFPQEPMPRGFEEVPDGPEIVTLERVAGTPSAH